MEREEEVREEVQSLASQLSEAASVLSRPEKPSFGERLHDIDDFVAKYKITSTLAHVVSLIKAKTTAQKLAYLVAIGENYQNGGLLNNAESLIKAFPNVLAFFQLLSTGAKVANVLEATPQEQAEAKARFDQYINSDVSNQGKFDSMNLLKGTFDPLLDIEEQEPETRDTLKTIEEWMPLLRPLLGIAAFMACAFGFDKLLEMSWIRDTSANVCKLAATLRAKKVIKEEVEEGVDSLLGLLYGAFGGTYIHPKAAKLAALNKKICALHEVTRRYVDNTKIDCFGLLRLENIPGLTLLVDDYSTQLATFQESEKSMFNFRDMMTEIRSNIKTIRDRRLALIKGAGKQEPVKIWFCGQPGVGKSDVANKVAIKLCGGRSVYTRNAQDKYFSTYAGQACVVFDDILQDPTSSDAGEWMSFSTGAAKDVVMAELDNKGTPFTSRFMIATSNYAYLLSHQSVNSIQAFNRRRDYLVHVSNPAVAQYKSDNNGEEPTRAWYVANPTKYYLYDPENISEIPYVPNVNTLGFIGEVTFDQLCAMALAMEKEKSEYFRQTLEASELAGVVTIPAPIQYDPAEYKCSLLYDKVTKCRRIAQEAPVLPPTAPSENSILSDDTTDQGPLTPVTTRTTTRNRAITLMGPPGIGKTQIVENIFLEVGVPYTKLTSEMVRQPNWLASLKNTGQAVWVDDFTTTPELCSAYRELCVTNDANELGLPLVVGTGNASTPAWKGDIIGQVKRRSHYGELAVSMQTYAKTLGKTLEKVLESGREGKVYMKIENQKVPYITIVTHLKRLCKNLTHAKITHTHEAFYLPYTEEFNILVKLPLSWEDSTVVNASEIYELVKGAQIFKDCVNGGGYLMSSKEKFNYMLKIAHLFKTAAYGTKEEFVIVFNREKSAPVIPDHVMVVFDCGTKLGFIPTDEQVCAYLPLPHGEEVQVINKRVYHRQVEQHYTSHNAPYYQALMRVFKQETSKVQMYDTPTQKDILKNLIRASPMGEFIFALIPALSLVTKFAACATLLHSIAERAGDSEEGVSEDPIAEDVVQPERRKPPPKPAPIDSDQGKNDNSKKRNQVTIPERRREPPKKVPSIDSDQGKADASYKKNQVRVNESRTIHDTDYTSSEDESTDRVRKSASKIREERRKVPSKVVPSIDSDQGRADASQKKNQVQIPSFSGVKAEAATVSADYQTNRPQQRKIRLIENESRDFVGSLVCNDGTFGFVTSGQVVYANENPVGVYTIAMSPSSPNWKEVDPEGFPKEAIYGKAPFKVTFNKRQLDDPAVYSAIGEQFIFPADSPIDFSSVFAFCHVYGIPFDYERLTLVPEIMPRVFGAETRTRAPTHLLRYMSGVFKKIEMPKQEIQQEGMYDPQIKQVIDVACKSAVVFETEQGHCVFGIAIGGNKIITVAHVSQHKNLHIRDLSGKLWAVSLQSINKACDLAVYAVTDRTFQARPDISHIFVKTEDLQKMLATNLHSIPGVIVIPPHYGSPFVNINHCAIRAEVSNDGTTDYNGRTLSYNATLNRFAVSGLTLPGECGSPLFIQNKTITGKLFGIHRAGNTCSSISSLVTQEWIKKILQNTEAINTEYNIQKEDLKAIKVPKQLKLRNEIVRCNTTDLFWCGGVDSPTYTPDTTRIHRTGIIIEEYNNFEPSLMSTQDPRAGGYQPLNEGLKRYGKEATPFTPDRLEVEEAFLQIGNELANRIITSGRDVRVFTKTEAINTPEFIEYPNARPIDRSGSAGFPHNLSRSTGTSKSDFLFFNEKQQKWYFKQDEHSQAISSYIDLIVDDAKKNEEHLHPFTAYLKDESLPLKKIYEVKKTRLFFSGSFEYLIAFRKYFLASMLRVMEMYAQIPCKVGISPEFHDWHTLATQLKRVSPVGFASDVSNFDSSVPKVFLEESVKVFNIIYERCSKPGENIIEGNLVRNVLHRAIEGPYVLSRKSLFKLTQAQVSGNPATAVENSFVMWALYYLVWKKLAQEHAPDCATYECFRKNVGLAVYGDDNICTVAPSFKWFNFNNFKRVAKTFGFEITDAAKAGGVVPDFQPLEELEFLKRKFVERQGYWTGPLSLKSVAKSVMWIRDGSYRITNEHVPSLGGAWPIAQNKDIITSSIEGMFPELALHGPEVFAEWRDNILKQAAPLGLSIQVPTWNDAIKRMGYNMY